jgi:hypothetical protein
VDGSLIRVIDPYPGFAGGVHVAVGDINDDGYLDIVTGAGPGGGPHVKVFDGKTGREIRSFFAYAPEFAGGVNVAVGGDYSYDGTLDIITAAGPGGGPLVKVFDFNSGDSGKEIYGFYAYDPDFRGGVNVAVGDLNGDGVADIISGAGPGGGPHVKLFDGRTTPNLRYLGGGPGSERMGTEFASFFAYDSDFRGGVNIALADLTEDGFLDIITGTGPGGGPHVRFFDGKTGREFAGLFAYDSGFRGGVNVAVSDLTGDGIPDLITSAGPSGGPHLKVIDGRYGYARADFFTDVEPFRGGIEVA